MTSPKLTLFCNPMIQIYSMLPWVCTEIDHSRRQIVDGASVTHSAAPPDVLTFRFHQILTPSVIYHDSTLQHGIYL